MRRTVSVTCALVFVLGVWASGALAYDYMDTTKVQEWKAGGVHGNWLDVIGNANIFDTFGANLNGGMFTIFTNWNPNKDGSVDAAVKTADLFIDAGCDGTWDYAIRLDTLLGTGGVYANPTYTTSDDIFKTKTGLIYGGKSDDTDPNLVPVKANSASTDTTSVIWTLGNIGLNNQVAIDLAEFDLKGQWCFVWGTATCSNDAFAGVVPVPLPPTVLLIGSGLLRVGLLRWRRRGLKASLDGQEG
jgi:hypothetical protein